MLDPSRLALLSASVITSLALSACAGSERASTLDDDKQDKVTEIPMAELESALALAYCERMFGEAPCCSKPDLDQMFPPEFLPADQIPTDVKSCVAYYERHDFIAGHIAQGVADGRLAYDARAAADCVAAIAGSCEFMADVTDPLFQAGSLWIFRLPSFCAEVATPTASRQCLEHVDCSADSFCARPPAECVENPDGSYDCSQPAPPGSCETKLAAGKPCANKACQSGLMCPAFADETSVCAPTLANGETCMTGDECTSRHCAKMDLNERGTCAPPAPFCQGA